MTPKQGNVLIVLVAITLALTAYQAIALRQFNVKTTETLAGISDTSTQAASEASDAADSAKEAASNASEASDRSAEAASNASDANDTAEQARDRADDAASALHQ